MNKIICLLLLLILQLNLTAQQLSIEETFNYIEDIENIYQGSTNGGDKVIIDYSLTDDGIFTKTTNFSKNGESRVVKTISAHVDDIVREWELGEYSSFIEFKCKNRNCFEVFEDGTKYIDKKPRNYFSNDNLHVFVKQEYQAKKIIKALEYAFSLIDEKDFQRDKGDPFAAMIRTSNQSEKISKIDLTESNGVYEVTARFGNLSESFILDSGASITTISSTLEERLLKNGIIDSNSYLPNALFRIADGSIITLRRARIKSISLGSFKVENLIVSIGNENSPLLLGRNFLDKFKNWKIHNDEKQIELSK